MTCAPSRNRSRAPHYQPAPTPAALQPFNLYAQTSNLSFSRSLHNGSVIAIPMLSSTVFANFHRLPRVPSHLERTGCSLSLIPLCACPSMVLTPLFATHSKNSTVTLFLARLPKSLVYKSFPCHISDTPTAEHRLLLTRSCFSSAATTICMLLILFSSLASGHTLSPRTESSPSFLAKQSASSGQSSMSPAAA